MKSWGAIWKEDIVKIFEHLGGFFQKMGHVFHGGGSAGAHGAKGFFGLLNNTAKVMALIPLKIAKGFAWMANTRVGGFLGAMVATVAVVIATIAGVASWHRKHHQRDAQYAVDQAQKADELGSHISETRARVAALSDQRQAASAAVGDPNAPDRNAEKLKVAGSEQNRATSPSM